MGDEKKVFDQKKYYEEHKEKILKQILESKKRQRRRKMIERLNNSNYKNVPYVAMEKNEIKFNEETKLYY